MPLKKNVTEELPLPLRNFLRNLASKLKNEPDLKLDLSVPGHCSLLRSVDTYYADTGLLVGDDDPVIPFDREVELENGEVRPLIEEIGAGAYRAEMRYALSEGYDLYSEEEEKKKKEKPPVMLPIDVGADGEIYTALTAAQLEVLHRTAREGKLIAVVPGNQIGTLSAETLLQIKADEDGGVFLKSFNKILKLPSVECTRDESLLEWGVLSFMHARKKRIEREEEQGTPDETIAAREEQSTLADEAAYLGFTPLSAEQIEKGQAMLKYGEILPPLGDIESLLALRVTRDGKEEPLFTPDELEPMNGSVYQRTLYAASKLSDALNGGEVYYNDAKGYRNRIKTSGSGAPECEKLGLSDERKKEMNVFFTNLRETLSSREPPIDLSDPDKLGLLQIVDVTDRDGNPADENQPVYAVGDSVPDGKGDQTLLKSSLYAAKVRYAAMPADEKGYLTPPPEGDESEKQRWLLDNQKPFTFGEDGSVSSDLGEDQLNAIYEAAKHGRLCVVNPGSSVLASEIGGFSVVKAGEGGSVTTEEITSVRKKPRGQKTDDEVKLIDALGVLCDESVEKNAYAYMSEYTDERIGCAAKNLAEPYFWKSRAEGKYVFTSDEIKKGKIFDENKPEGVDLRHLDALRTFFVVDDGSVTPLFDPETLKDLTGGESDPEYLALYAGSRLDAAARKGILFRKGSDGKFTQITVKKQKYDDLFVEQALPEGEEKIGMPFKIRFARFFRKNAYQAEYDRITAHNRAIEFRDTVRSYREEEENAPMGESSAKGTSLAEKLLERHGEEFGALNEEQKKNVARNLALAEEKYQSLLCGEGKEEADPDAVSGYFASVVISKLIARADGKIVEILASEDGFERMTARLAQTEPLKSRLFEKNGAEKKITVSQAAALPEEDGGRFVFDVIAGMSGALEKKNVPDAGNAGPKTDPAAQQLREDPEMKKNLPDEGAAVFKK